MKRDAITSGLGTIGVVALLACVGQAQTNPPAQPPPPARPADSSAERGYCPSPADCGAISAELQPHTVQMFMNDDFQGNDLTVTGIDTSVAPGSLNELGQGLNDSMSSVRWNLPPGIIIVFYEDGSGKGEQLILWGQGEYGDLDKVDFNDKVSRWSWYDIGGGASGSAEAKLPPRGAEISSIAVPRNTMQMHIDKNYRDDMEQISPLTGSEPSKPHQIPSKMRDSLTSMRWNLPDGVIVMLYQDAGAKKQQIAIWGHGQVADLDAWDFNDKVSRWSWSYLGAPPKPESPAGESPSVTPTRPPTSPPRTPPPPSSPPSTTSP